MKSFSERNLFVIGAIGLTLTAGIVVAALNYQKLPFFNRGKTYSAYFADAGGLTTGARGSGVGHHVGKVSAVELDGPRVLVTFKIDKDIRLGERSEAAIKTKSLLGTKFLEVTSRGDGRQDGTIPLDRTTLAVPVARRPGRSGHDDQRAEHRPAVGFAAGDRADVLRDAARAEGRRRGRGPILGDPQRTRRPAARLLGNANKATGVLAERSDQMVSLVKNTNALLAELQSQSAALDQISGNISALSQQLKGFIAENRDTMKPALDKLNGVLTIIDNRKERLQKSSKCSARTRCRWANRYPPGRSSSRTS